MNIIKKSSKNKVFLMLMGVITFPILTMGVVLPRVGFITALAGSGNVKVDFYDIYLVDYSPHPTLNTSRFTIKVLMDIRNGDTTQKLIIPRLSLNLSYLGKPVGQAWITDELILEPFTSNISDSAGFLPLYVTLYVGGTDSGFLEFLNGILLGQFGAVGVNLTVYAGDLPVNMDTIIGELFSLIGLVGGSEMAADPLSSFGFDIDGILGMITGADESSGSKKTDFPTNYNFLKNSTNIQDIRYLFNVPNATIFSTTDERYLFGTSAQFQSIYWAKGTDGHTGFGDTGEITNITCVADVGNSLNSTYFNISTPTVDYYVWYNLTAGTPDPGFTGKTGIQVDTINTDDGNETVANETANALNNYGGGSIFSVARKNETITVTNAVPGVATDASNGNATGFIFTKVRDGHIPQYSWEYWSGTSWKTLTVTDGTNKFTKTGSITFTKPTDWKPKVLVDFLPENYYYVQCKAINLDSGLNITMDTSNSYVGAINAPKPPGPAATPVVYPELSLNDYPLDKGLLQTDLELEEYFSANGLDFNKLLNDDVLPPFLTGLSSAFKTPWVNGTDDDIPSGGGDIEMMSLLDSVFGFLACHNIDLGQFLITCEFDFVSIINNIGTNFRGFSAPFGNDTITGQNIYAPIHETVRYERVIIFSFAIFAGLMVGLCVIAPYLASKKTDQSFIFKNIKNLKTYKEKVKREMEKGISMEEISLLKQAAFKKKSIISKDKLTREDKKS